MKVVNTTYKSKKKKKKKTQIILPKIFELFSAAKHNNKKEKENENMPKERKGTLLEAN